MTATEDAKPFTIEPLDPAKHDRAAFSCGVTQVDNFFRRTANKLAKADNIRTRLLKNSVSRQCDQLARNMIAYK